MRIGFSGFFVDSSGYGEMSRRYLAALLHAEGADVTPAALLADGGWQIPPSPPLQQWMGLRRVAPPDVHLLCVAGADMDKIYPKEIPKHVPRVGMMCWETDRLHQSTILGCKTVDKVIVPSEHNAAVLARAGVKAVVVPIPVDIPPYIDELPLKGLEEVKPDTFVFYSVLTWQDRKNPFGLLAAYANAFTDKDNVLLALKIAGPEPDKATQQAAELGNRVMEAMGLTDAPPIMFLGGKWSPQMLWALHYRGNCYLSLAKGEAYGLPILDATAIGNHVIATDYGGHLDFLQEGTSDRVRYRMAPVLQRYSHFDARQRWADPDVLHAAELMRAVYDRGQRPKILPDLTHLLPYNIGTKLVEALYV